METTDRRETVTRQDEIVKKLLDLVRRGPQEIAEAGARIMSRIQSRTSSELEDKRGRVRAERDRIERARELVLAGRECPRDPDLDPSEQRDLNGLVTVLGEYETKHGDLGTVSAMEAYLTDYVERYQAEEERLGLALTPRAEHRSRRIEDLDPERVENALHTLPFQLGLEILGFMRQEPDRIRLSSEWWEVVVLVLSIEYPDIPPEQLGLVGALPWGDWEKPGDDTFAHRDGMRAYIGRAPTDHEKEQHDKLFWLLAERGVTSLQEFKPGALATLDSAPAKPVTPSIEDGRAAPLRGWAEICEALGVQNDRPKQRQLKAMNERTSGPIVWVRGKPEVIQARLLAWIRDSQELARRAEDARASDQAAGDELQERDGMRQQDYGFHSEKRPNAKGRVGPAPDDDK